MTSEDMLLPGLALAGLTFVVWLRLYFERFGQMKRERIHPQSVASSEQMRARLSDTRAADNFRNLFELPVLFYFALVVAVLTAQVSIISLGLAWAFVLLRVVHSAIHCTSNKVKYRFLAYLAGGLALWSLVAYLSWGLLA